ncbi:hypothetical protein BGZ65_003202 [Modicella reniformis]|uniref:Uncharacterized protein n=1 Tax=Modicella reniformis TaxID=1440133 RepID=A0A9P6J0D0_9FUNG|nr:hypothetical protein BGZ65_003202 [Modicella reniformis]
MDEVDLMLFVVVWISRPAFPSQVRLGAVAPVLGAVGIVVDEEACETALDNETERRPGTVTRARIYRIGLTILIHDEDRLDKGQVLHNLWICSRLKSHNLDAEGAFLEKQTELMVHDHSRDVVQSHLHASNLPGVQAIAAGASISTDPVDPWTPTLGLVASVVIPVV